MHFYVLFVSPYQSVLDDFPFCKNIPGVLDFDLFSLHIKNQSDLSRYVKGLSEETQKLRETKSLFIL